MPHPAPNEEKMWEFIVSSQWEELRGVALLKEAYHWGRGLRFLRYLPFPMSSFLSFCLWIKM